MWGEHRAVNVVTETFAKTSSISSVHFVYFLSAASKKFQCKGLMMMLKMINLLELMVSPLQEIEKLR